MYTGCIKKKDDFYKDNVLSDLLKILKKYPKDAKIAVDEYQDNENTHLVKSILLVHFNERGKEWDEIKFNGFNADFQVIDRIYTKEGQWNTAEYRMKQKKNKRLCGLVN